MSLLIFLKNIIQLILSPSVAWNDIQRDETPFDQVLARGLYPLMAIMLVSAFIRPIYGFEDFDLVRLLQTALIEFVALFVGLFAGRNIMEHFLPMYNCTGQNDPVAVGNVAAYGTGLMTLIQLAENLIPIELTVMQLLPALAAVCIWKSDRYLDIDSKGEIPFMLIAVISLIAPVIFINLILTVIIN